MSFTGTQEKCKACDKTVYVMDQLSADGVSFHKSCFKCSHCKGTLKVTVENQAYHKTCFKCSYGGCSLSPSNYAALDGVLYCKHHFSQLFKEKGSYNHLLTRSPSKAAGMFSGTQEKCATCGKTAYPLEKVTVENQAYHKTCFKCSYGGCSLSPSNYAALDGVLYCKHHFSQLFKEKGSYNHLLVKSASMRRGPATVPES
ncbi:hypothetical protein ACHQM5_024524 [Ranunculus cassubicifolius]